MAMLKERDSMFNLIKWCAVFFTAVSFCFSQSITISGKVSDAEGQAISGAVVTLQNAGIQSTTAADGRFSLTNSAPISQNGRAYSNFAGSIRNGVLSIHIAQKSEVTITSYSLEGRILSRVRKLMDVGSHSITLQRSGSGIHFYKVELGKKEIFLKTYSTDGVVNSAAQSVLSSQISGSLSKLSKPAAFDDALTVKKYGYLDYTMPLTSAEMSGIEIQMQKDDTSLEPFSFFVTSLAALQELSGSEDGFGGDYRFGETGPGAGLRGADKICETIAEMSMPGSGAKQWRAFLSVTDDGTGKQVNAIDRIGEGPWYDRLGKVLAPTKADLLHDRPQNGDPAIADDLPNENGIPNNRPDPLEDKVDNHLTVTGSNELGELFGPTSTCDDWTSTTSAHEPRVGFSWPQSFGIGMPGGGGGFPIDGNLNGKNWISGWSMAGCEAGIDLDYSTGAGKRGDKSIGSGGGYGGFYCFALNP